MYSGSMCKECRNKKLRNHHNEHKDEDNKKARERRAETDYNSYARAFYQNDEEARLKRAARQIANVMFPIAQPCEVPGCVNIGERHHDDYTKPTEIRWRCKELHHRD